MKPISTSTLGMSAAFSTTKPACRSGFGSIGRSLSRLPTRLRASRLEPIRVSRRTRLARMRATSGEALKPAPADPVGAVLALRQRRGLRIRGRIGECIDAGAAHRVVGQRIGVHRDEQRRAVRLRLRDPLVERDERVPGPGQRHPVAALRLQLPLQFERRGQRHLLLVGAGKPDRARILAAMAGIQHHQRRRRACALTGGRGWSRAAGAMQAAASAAARQQERADDARPRPEAAEQQAARDWWAERHKDLLTHRMRKCTFAVD